jgi:hypothetical protein
MINAELAFKIKRSGVAIAEVGVRHYARQSGAPTGASIRVVLKSFSDLFRLWLKLR